MPKKLPRLSQPRRHEGFLVLLVKDAIVVLLILLLVSFAEFASAADETPARPNIVLLLADDWRHDTLACAGNPVVKTPNLDQLASEGVRFRQACVTTSICGVSRASSSPGSGCRGTAIRAFARVQDAVGGDVSRPAASERLLRRSRRQVAQRQVSRRAVRLRPLLLRARTG